MRRWLLALAVAVVGCDDDSGDEGIDAEPFYPADFEAAYSEVRPCMPSGDHDLNNVRILVDAAAMGPYVERVDPFPVDAVVVKAEYDFGDTACAGEISFVTVMKKLAAGSSPDTLDWAWQKVSVEREVLEEDTPRCISCHTGCGVPPDGHDGVCAILE